MNIICTPRDINCRLRCADIADTQDDPFVHTDAQLDPCRVIPDYFENRLAIAESGKTVKQWRVAHGFALARCGVCMQLCEIGAIQAFYFLDQHP